ncbi:hypothetical protein COU60_05145 [Candidatus Pacearchaeota archaeon CG10_big_fil_rev_8_21_14_0_10_34_76]|nr:MAG: hypothetical protein COU60_05145 [Candidatus Pacearchaeota archaeon CG10_big_fil_rev_8_21_14_0_10_34_76]
MSIYNIIKRRILEKPLSGAVEIDQGPSRQRKVIWTPDNGRELVLGDVPRAILANLDDVTNLCWDSFANDLRDMGYDTSRGTLPVQPDYRVTISPSSGRIIGAFKGKVPRDVKEIADDLRRLGYVVERA